MADFPNGNLRAGLVRVGMMILGAAVVGAAGFAWQSNRELGELRIQVVASADKVDRLHDWLIRDSVRESQRVDALERRLERVEAARDEGRDRTGLP